MQTHNSILVAILALSLASLMIWNSSRSGSTEFQAWKARHAVKYATVHENDYREMIFQSNLHEINLHNSNPHRTYDKGVNQFTALTQQEFAAQYCYQISLPLPRTGGHQDPTLLTEPTVNDVDWVANGAVTRVKNQGQCTSGSWAFSATGSLEGLNKIAYGSLRTFSDQQLLDCSGTLCSCSGGFTDMAFRYIQSHGLCQEGDYPYTQVKQSCRPTQCTFKISDYDYVDNCNGLGKLIAQRPISVAVEGSNWASYQSGVFSDCTTKMNMMVLLVGVVQGNWKIKNSWGAGWGEQGYIRLAPGNTCGVCSIGLYPIK